MTKPPPASPASQALARTEKRMTRRDIVLGVILLALIGYIAQGYVSSRNAASDQSDRADTAIEQREDAESNLQQLADPLARLCAEDPTVRARVGEECDTAERVVDAPTQRPQQPTGLDRGEVLDIVNARLALLPPPPTPEASIAQVTDVVTDVLAANPPEPGRPPTADEVRSVVEAYFEDNPVRDGTDCDPADNPDCRGPGPTQEQIDEAVARRYAENPPPPGEPGKPPARFTFTDSTGTTQDCTRDQGSPDDAATYTCEPRPEPEPSQPPAQPGG